MSTTMPSASISESARVAFMTGIGLRARPHDAVVVIRRIEIDFLAELNYPPNLNVGLSVLKLGTTSITLGLGVFQDTACHATGRAVMVRFDRATRRSTALSDEERSLVFPLPNLEP